MMSVQYKRGNIVDDGADVLVNTVNCVKVMGKGVALEFKLRYPEIIQDYNNACDIGSLVVGGCLLFQLPNQTSIKKRYWAALATKDHWRYPSKYVWIRSGLLELAKLASSVGAISIAIPRPGCGNGGLDWDLVRPMVLDTLSSFDLRIYNGIK